MPRLGSTGVIQVHFCEDGVLSRQNIADGEVTLAQLATAVDLTDWLLRDGLDTPLDGNTFDVAGAKSRYNATEAGTYGGQPIRLDWFRDSDEQDDVAWDTLPRGTRGVFVIARFGHDGSSEDPLEVGDRVELWPATVISRAHRQIEADGAYRFHTSCSVPFEPNDDAEVVAGS